MSRNEYYYIQNPGCVAPAVSWLLCSHVFDDNLIAAISSCLDQTFTDFELVFIANGPLADQIAESVTKLFLYDKRLRTFSTPLCHLPFSLSLGLHHARAPLVARMDSDDISVKNRLELQYQFMNDHPEVSVLGTAYQMIDENGHAKNTIYMPTSNFLIRLKLLWGNPLCHPTVMYRRRAILEIGGYLGGLHAEDYDLWSRLALNPNLVFANLPHVCLGYRVIGVGAARRSLNAYASVASCQFRNFLVGGGGRWWFASMLSVIKLMFRFIQHRSVK